MWIGGVILFVGLAFLVYASYSIRAGVYLRAFCGLKTSQKIISLTFDDGPDVLNTVRVLEVLKKYGVKATFFCIGEKAETHPELVKRMVEEGHSIGNHSWSHKAGFPLLSRGDMCRELQRTRQLLEGITGQNIPLFRPPFGVTNPVVAAAVRRLGLKAIGWSIRSLDTRGEKTEKVLARIKKRLKPGAVLLLHDRLSRADELLEQLLPFLWAENYRVVRVDEMIDAGKGHPVRGENQ